MSEKSQVMKEKQEAKARKEEQQRENKENILLDMNMYGGLWVSPAQMEAELGKLATTKGVSWQ